MLFCHLLFFWFVFSNLTFSKISFENTIILSNSLDPVQAQHFFRPDLGPNCKSNQQITLVGKELKCLNKKAHFSSVNVKHFGTLVACQRDQTNSTKSDQSSLINVFPICYSNKHFVNSRPENQHFI